MPPKSLHQERLWSFRYVWTKDLGSCQDVQLAGDDPGASVEAVLSLPVSCQIRTQSTNIVQIGTQHADCKLFSFSLLKSALIHLSMVHSHCFTHRSSFIFWSSLCLLPFQFLRYLPLRHLMRRSCAILRVSPWALTEPCESDSETSGTLWFYDIIGWNIICFLSFLIQDVSMCQHTSLASFCINC